MQWRSKSFGCGKWTGKVSIIFDQKIIHPFRFVIGDPDDAARVTCFALSSDNSHIFVSYNNGIIKQYRLHEASATMMYQFRSTHTGPILVCALSADSQTLFTGSSDYSVKVWNIDQRICTHTLKGLSVVSALCLVNSTTIIIGYVEGQLRIYDIGRRASAPKELNIHSRFLIVNF